MHVAQAAAGEPKMQKFWPRLLLARSSYPKTALEGNSRKENCTEKLKTPTQRGAQDKINGLLLKASRPFPLVFLLILHGDSILIVVFALCFGCAVQQTNNKRISDWGNILKHNKRRQKRSVEISRFTKIYTRTYVCLYVPESPGRTFGSSLTVCVTPSAWFACRLCGTNAYKLKQSFCGSVQKMCLAIFKEFVKHEGVSGFYNLQP